MKDFWNNPQPWMPPTQAPTGPSTKELEAYFKAINDKVPADPPGEHNVGFGYDDKIDSLAHTSQLGKKSDAGKPDYTLLPFKALEGTVKVLGFGAVKYGRDNWQKVERRRYIAAAFRHLIEIAKGNQTDEESGEDHADHLTCCSLFISAIDKG